MNKKPKSFKHRYALLVGINEPLDHHPLRYCDRDARILYRLFEKFGFKGPAPLIPNSNQSSSGEPLVINTFVITHEINNIKNKLNLEPDHLEDSLVLIYLSGHGISLQRQFYFATEDGRLEYYDILDLLGKARFAGQVVIIVDACHAEDIRAATYANKVSTKGKKSIKVNESSAAAHEDENSVDLLFASTEENVTYEENEFKMGILSHFLRETLYGFQTRQPILSWSELRDSLKALHHKYPVDWNPRFSDGVGNYEIFARRSHEPSCIDMSDSTDTILRKLSDIFAACQKAEIFPFLKWEVELFQSKIETLGNEISKSFIEHRLSVLLDKIDSERIFSEHATVALNLLQEIKVIAKR